VSESPACELTIVIASQNRRELLRRCLRSLSEQDQDPSSFEVIVADDGSSDGTADMAEGLETPFQLRVLRLEKSGKSAALNAATPSSKADVCLFLDDDVVASPRLVAEHLAAHRDNPMALGIGALTQEPPPSPDWFSSAYARDWNRRYRELADKHMDWTDCYGGNFSAPREALHAVGGFSVDLAAIEDIELGYRLCQAGCVPTFLPGAHGLHDDHKSRRRMLADLVGFGSFCAEFTERNHDAYSKLLGWFGDTTPRDLALRRLLIALRMPPSALARLGGLIPGEDRRQVWFGFVSRHCFWLGVRNGMSRERWAQATRGVPVLMYHAFADDRDGGARFVVSRRAFGLQMRALAALRYRVISLEDLADALREQRPLPRRAVVITVDDGYVDNARVAQPILRRHDFPATIFLVSRRLGAKNDWDSDGELRDRPLLSVEEARAMGKGGIEVGAHTETHRSLPDAEEKVAAREIEGSRIDLESALGASVTTFAYPYGRLDDRVVAIVRRAGYNGACGVSPHLVHRGGDPLRIPRLEVRASDSIVRFLRKLWLGGP
jgi:peptidoglycan/xylan/chitin deacetylase (PgdA/CDA1 family)/glycosyltransferase involved in cell wall biosynthesis